MLWFRTPEKVYFKKGCLPVALNELKDVMGKKRAFIVTDSFLYKNGYTNVITDRLNEMGITYTVFSDVQPDPTLANAQAGAKLMKEFGCNYRNGRRLRNGCRKDHVGTVRASGSRFHGYGNALYRYPQESLYLPEDG